MTRWWRRLRARIRNRHFERDLAREIEVHRAMKEEEFESAGDSQEAARRSAARALGNLTMARENSRAMWIPLLLQQVVQDVRYALRGMRRTLGFTLAAVSMLTVGLGLVAGGYTVFNGLFFRAWNVPDPDDVFRVSARREVEPAAGQVTDGLSVGAYEYLRANARAAEYVASAVAYFDVRADGASQAMWTEGRFASDNLIETLRIPLQRGTGLVNVPEGGPPRIVISDHVWRQVFGADPNVVGRTAWLNDVPTTVWGVTGPGFDGLGPEALGVVIDMSRVREFGSYSGQYLDSDPTKCCAGSVAGRIRPGSSLAQAREEAEVLVGQYRQSVGQPRLSIALNSTVLSEDLFEGRQGQGRTLAVALGLIGTGLVLVMLLTSANVGNLYLARSLRREREIAVRLSLGASRARVVRQFVTEGLVLAAVAGLGAFMIAAGVPVLLQTIERDATFAMFAPDWRVAAFTAAAVVGTCVVVSLTPALQATRIAWRGANATMSSRAGWLRGGVLAVQIAIASVLVLTAALMGRGMQHALTARADYALRTTTVATIQPPADRELPANRIDDIRAALGRQAAVSDLRPGLAMSLLSGGRLGLGTQSVRRADSDAEFHVQVVPLSASAFRVLDLSLVAGRFASDDPTIGEVVINETLARMVWPGETVLGKPLVQAGRNSLRRYEIVGVVRDAHLTSFSTVEPILHVPPSSGIPVLLARTAPGTGDKLRALVSAVDPELVVTVRPLSASAGRMLENARIGAAIAGGLGILALLLAIVGVFGVFSYLVEERRREIGIRLALGASRIQIGATLFRACRRAIAGGLIAGVLLSVISGQALRGFLFGLSPLDPASYLGVALVLGVAALTATAIPVRRALRIDPAVTLKAE
jgi:predicted permease